MIAASVYAFLSWAGFEGAATLGEETANPKRNIPRAIVWSVGAIGVFYVITMLAETLGFGTSAAGVHAFATAAAPFSTLSHGYIGSPMADALDLAMTASQIGCALACSSAAARILFALARDGFGPALLGRALARSGSPFPALSVVIPACAAFSIGQRPTVTLVTEFHFGLAYCGSPDAAAYTDRVLACTHQPWHRVTADVPDSSDHRDSTHLQRPCRRRSRVTPRQSRMGRRTQRSTRV